MAMTNGLDVGIGKYSLKTSGMVTIFILLLGGAVGAMWWEMKRHESVMVREHKELREEVRIHSYLLSLPANERPVLLAPSTLSGRIDHSR